MCNDGSAGAAARPGRGRVPGKVPVGVRPARVPWRAVGPRRRALTSLVFAPALTCRDKDYPAVWVDGSPENWSCQTYQDSALQGPA